MSNLLTENRHKIWNHFEPIGASNDLIQIKIKLIL